jgi:The GLUG motif.
MRKSITIMAATLMAMSAFALCVLLPVDDLSADGPANSDNWTDTGNYDTDWYTTGSPYSIGTPEDLAGLALLTPWNDFTGEVFKLTADLNLSAHYWTPIGTSAEPFTGTFDGNGFEISGLYISMSGEADEEYQGLFGCTAASATISNVILLDSEISGIGYYGYVGGIVGYSEGTISDCYFEGLVKGVARVGGIAGHSTGSITNSENAGHIENQNSGYLGFYYSFSTVGGIVGYNEGSITDCDNSGTVAAHATNVGGIAGINSGTIFQCSNAGDVETNDHNIGGIVGSSTGTVTDCYNTGTIQGNAHTGGIVGYSEGATSNCYNTGTIYGGGDMVGGIVGSSTDAVTDCYNMGDVYGGEYDVGGIVGQTAGIVSGCYSAGTIQGSYHVGGIVGAMDGGSIDDCYNRNDMIEGDEYVGGIVGELISGTIANCYSAGNISSSGSEVGPISGNLVIGTGLYWLTGIAGSTGGLSTEQMTGGTVAASNMPVLAADGGWFFRITDDDWIYFPELKAFAESSGQRLTDSIDSVKTTGGVSGYTITATVNDPAGGSISPSGAVPVTDIQTFNITVNEGYKISDVKVDAGYIGAVTSYTFTSIDANHTISVEFEMIELSITTSVSVGGTISPSGSVEVLYGGSETFTITPNSGYAIFDVMVDGSSVGMISTYTFSDVKTDRTISAEFKALHDITTSVRSGDGTISLVGPSTRIEGSEAEFTITPGAGWELYEIYVNNELVPRADPFSLIVTEDVHVEVIFTNEPLYNVTTDFDGTRGNVKLSNVVVKADDTVTVTITPNTGQKASAEVSVGTITNTGSNTYEITDIDADCVVKVTFTADTAPGGSGWWLWLILLILIVIVIVAYYFHERSKKTKKNKKKKKTE